MNKNISRILCGFHVSSFNNSSVNNACNVWRGTEGWKLSGGRENPNHFYFRIFLSGDGNERPVEKAESGMQDDR